LKILKILTYSLPVLVFVIVSTVRDMQEGALGTKNNPIKLYFTPSVDAKTISFNARALVDYLEKETGYYFTTALPASYVAVVEAFGTGKADIASINTFSYLMANAKYGAQAKLIIVRDNNEASYRGAFITRTDSGIDSLQDLNGKSFAYVDPSSTSGYILAKAVLDSLHIHPSETVFAMRHDNVVTMVYQRQVDAGAIYYDPPDPKTGQVYDARERVESQFPDVVKKVKIIGFTPPIPNDPWVFRKGMPENMKDKIINALLKFVKTPEGAKALYNIYDVRGFIRAKDSDYDQLRRLLARENISFEDLVKK
jgi:phosphonate transport system substrate-binding protein